MTLKSFTQGHDLLLVLEESLTHRGCSLFRFQILDPIFFIFLVQYFEGALQLSLLEVEESLLIWASKVEADGISIAQ